MNDIVLVSKHRDFSVRPRLLINGTEITYSECEVEQMDGFTTAHIRIPVRSMVTLAEEDGELMQSVRKALGV